MKSPKNKKHLVSLLLKVITYSLASVFAPHSGNKSPPPPPLPGTQCPKMKPLDISENGVLMLPDRLYGRLLHCLAKEITPVVHYIFTQSLGTGELPTEWTQANVAPIFKKGSKLHAVSIHPVSLTCKLFEHIICKHILTYLEDHINYNERNRRHGRIPNWW